MKIQCPSKQQVYNASWNAFQGAISLGFGLLTAEKFLKIVKLANEVFICRDSSHGCQSSFIDLAKESAVSIACGFVSLKLGHELVKKFGYLENENHEHRYVSRIVRAKSLDSLQKSPQEISAFHPGERMTMDLLSKKDN